MEFGIRESLFKVCEGLQIRAENKNYIKEKRISFSEASHAT
jgi:hypothetical protein